MINRMILQSRLTKDIEVKTTQNGTCYAEFTVAWNERIKEFENKCFLRCKAWNNTATFLSNYFQRGSQILIEGQMRTEEWTDKDGNNQSRMICNVEKVHFCGSKSDNTSNNDWTNTPLSGDILDATVDEESDLLF